MKKTIIALSLCLALTLGLFGSALAEDVPATQDQTTNNTQDTLPADGSTTADENSLNGASSGGGGGGTVDPGSKSQVCQGFGEAGGDCTNSSKSTSTINALVKTIINVLSVVVGIFAVIMIIVAGFRYITAGGDTNALGAAKNTLVYALIGLVVVLLAQVIVHFVIGKVLGIGS